MKKNKILISAMLCFLLAASFFVMNKKEAHAAGNYWLQVNKGTNVVTVFRNDGTPERAFVCSVGNATPIGTFYTPNKYRWHELDGPSYGQYCTRITAGYLFHSVWYYRNGDYASQSYVQYNKLGTTASHGCVRLTVADAKWIYDNCPLGTRVTVMYGSSANDPLGKPVAIKVPNVREGWDPTDPAPGNPYSAAMPSIDVSGANTTVSYGSNFNPLAGIAAKDSLGNDITGRLAYAGSVNTRQIGDYRITYRVTDALGRTAYADVVYSVKDTEKASITGVKASLKKEYNSTLKLKKNVKAKTVTGADLTNQIKIKVIYPGSKTEKTYKKSTLKLNKLGTYKINYYVTNPANGLETKVTCSVKVSDTKKPKFSGIKSTRTKEYNTTMNLKSGVKAKLVSGKNMTSKIVVKAKAPGQKKYKKLSASQCKKYKFSKVGTYQIEYSVTNPYNKKAVAKKVMKVTVKDTKKPILNTDKGQAAKNPNVEFGTKLKLKSNVTAKLVSGKSVTNKIEVTVTTPQKNSSKFTKTEYTFNQLGTYTIVYTVANPNNAKAVAKKTLTVTVKDTKAPIITGVGTQENVEFGTSRNLRAGVTAKLASGEDLTSKLEITVNAPNGTSSKVAETNYTFEQAGTYTVVYNVANPLNTQAVAQANKRIVVTDNRVPVISIADDKQAEVAVGTPYEVFNGVTAAVGQEDVPVTATITDENGQPITITNRMATFQQEGTYTIAYTAVNPRNASKTDRKDFTVTVKKQQNVTEDTATQPEPGDTNPQMDEPEQPEHEAKIQDEAKNQGETDIQGESENQDETNIQGEAENQDETNIQGEAENQDETNIQGEAENQDEANIQGESGNQDEANIQDGMNIQDEAENQDERNIQDEPNVQNEAGNQDKPKETKA